MNNQHPLQATVTPTNKDKRVRFAELVTSSNNIPEQIDSLKTKDSNKTLLTSIGVKPTTSANGSKPSGNTKNNRISRPPRSNQKNKVEDHPRTMLQNIDREDLETLWKLVKAKHGLTRPEEGYERVLWGDLKVMFEPDIESEVWRNLQGHKVTVWKLFSSTVVLL
ncbi:hypothetical protein Tco_0800438 [Tanacetum coccineum]|uniref:Uncharacterized protein n=1 Tax=Tanacetum coccineum TaxID=301880 RepID=A0ABQ4ZU34_9ASTR